ncbi:sn-glycerol-3-phosphate ABC transporter ATP-binding protein UgpC [Allorhizobium sp. BGMRC 0089]|uniref:ABC transporter ATP-binding protein n=1 Tax=Allorhizobium sonneratiae TaxID=2934936 RepID=UPI0020342CF9|nr:sn-glycerol-3-phosphate ABC transporter ATP-binding protein UgpC [Allorhizobium sonneratiae]MCM2293282.1 sn-glycerol-3-phosphate ABC transporter ATP-binding protein UgpC [Allorhizobium sonneratiae]
MAELTLSGLKKSYGTHQVIHGIDLSVRDGEFVVFVGPSGCGKSTLLRMIAGLESVSEGRLAIGGEDVTERDPGKRGIAMVFQSYALYPHMTVRQNLSFSLENLKLPKAEIEARVAEAARMLAIDTLLERRPMQLSGGQRQRVAIGRAIVRDPKVFLFDEPLSNLDAALRVQTRGEISRLHKRLGSTMIYVTHDQIEAMTMADRIAVLNGGRLEQFGAPLELFEYPVNTFVAGFIGSPRMNFFDGVIEAATQESVTVQVPGFSPVTVKVDGSMAKPGQKVIFGFRPNHVRLTGEANDDCLRLRFSIGYTECIGTETYLFGQVDGNDKDTVLHLADHLSVAEGGMMDVLIDPARCHVFDAETGLAFARRRADGTLY